ncbi:hypothetical protein [Streptomyces sp. NPDC048710]
MSWKNLRDCRLKGGGVRHGMLGIARLHNLTLTAYMRPQGSKIA